jgi:hypothetical protein
MTQKTLQILGQVAAIQNQLAILAAPQNRINQLNAALAALQSQLTAENEPDAASLAFAIQQVGNAVSTVQTVATATQTTLAAVALRSALAGAAAAVVSAKSV